MGYLSSGNGHHGRRIQYPLGSREPTPLGVQGRPVTISQNKPKAIIKHCAPDAFPKINSKRTFFNCNSVTSTSANPCHEWRFINCSITLLYDTQISASCSLCCFIFDIYDFTREGHFMSPLPPLMATADLV